MIDTKFDEVQRVIQAAPNLGLTVADGQLSFAQVTVSDQEAVDILQQLLQELIRLSGRYVTAPPDMIGNGCYMGCAAIFVYWCDV